MYFFAILSCSIIQTYYKIVVLYQKKKRKEKPVDILIRTDDT